MFQCSSKYQLPPTKIIECIKLYIYLGDSCVRGPLGFCWAHFWKQEHWNIAPISCEFPWCVIHLTMCNSQEHSGTLRNIQSYQGLTNYAHPQMVEKVPTTWVERYKVIRKSQKSSGCTEIEGGNKIRGCNCPCSAAPQESSGADAENPRCPKNAVIWYKVIQEWPYIVYV